MADLLHSRPPGARSPNSSTQPDDTVTALRIRELDLQDADTEGQVRRVVGGTFGRTVHPGAILRNTRRGPGGLPTRYLGAFQGGELVGFAAFLGHRFVFDGEFLPTYQRCWSSVLPSAQGKGIYTVLVEEAKELLRASAHLLIGFPNANSAPVTTGRLGFQNQGGFLRCLLPAHPHVAAFGVGKPPAAPLPPALEQDHGDQYLLKRDEGRHPTFLHEDPTNNVFWGIVRRSPRFGGRLRVASVGGVLLNNPLAFGEGVRTLVGSLGVSAIEFTAHRSSHLALLLRRMRPLRGGPPLTTFALRPIPEITRWNLSLGVLDAF